MTTLTSTSVFSNNCALESIIAEATILVNALTNSPVTATIVKKANFFNVVVSGLLSINVGYLCLGNALATKPIEINQVFFTMKTDTGYVNITSENLPKIEEMCKTKNEGAKFIFKDGVILCYK
jgi:hypothetical protein